MKKICEYTLAVVVYFKLMINIVLATLLSSLIMYGMFNWFLNDMIQPFVPTNLPQTNQSTSLNSNPTDSLTPVISNLLQSINEINELNNELNPKQKTKK